MDAYESAVSKPDYLSPYVETVLGYTAAEWVSTPGLYQTRVALLGRAASGRSRARSRAACADARDGRAVEHQGGGDRHGRDGFFASGFDGPARAIRCAGAIRDAVSALGLDIRVGVHTGECDVVDGKLAGLGVVIGARVAGEAAPGRQLQVVRLVQPR